MKVQLQTNYSTRNVIQNTNKAKVCAKPNFSSTFLISKKQNTSWLLFKGLTDILESLKPTSKKNINKNWPGGYVNHILMSFPESKDDEVVKALKKVLHGEKDVKCHLAPIHSIPQEQLNATDINQLPVLYVNL